MKAKIMVLLALLSFSSVSFACSCIQESGSEAQKVEKRFQLSDAVLVGLVKTIKPLDSYRAEITLQVKRAWKGNVRRTTVMKMSTQSAMCGLKMNKGAEYLIYAHKYDSSDPQSPLSTGLCSRTKETKYASDDLKVLTKKRAVQVRP